MQKVQSEGQRHLSQMGETEAMEESPWFSHFQREDCENEDAHSWGVVAEDPLCLARSDALNQIRVAEGGWPTRLQADWAVMRKAQIGIGLEEQKNALVLGYQRYPSETRSTGAKRHRGQDEEELQLSALRLDDLCQVKRSYLLVEK